MTTITQVLTTLPAPPARSQAPATFIANGDAFLAALPALVTQQNTLTGQINTVAGEVSTNATTATTQASTATTQAGIATGAATTATTQAGVATSAASAASASAASAAAIAGAFVGTSTSSLLIATGSKTFTTQTGEQYTAGIWMTAVSAANTANWMFGQVTSYSGTTLVLDVQAIGGSGTYADWNLSLTGARGATGPAGTLSGTAAGAIELLTGTNIASASTVNLNTSTGNRIHITGTTTINTVTLTRGPRTIIFDGILTLTHHATNNNLPGAANITTAAGDRAIYESDGTTVYCVSYIKVSGASIVAEGAGDHAVTVHTGNGRGSTNTAIDRFTTAMVNVGTAITYADSAAGGASFTINNAGIYEVFYQFNASGSSGVYFGFSVNSTELSTAINAINIANRSAFTGNSSAGYPDAITRTMRLAVNDVVRPHSKASGGTDLPAPNSTALFSIRKVGV